MYEGSVTEKRSYFRMQLNCPVTLSSVDGNEHVEGRCINMSIKGILLELDRSVDVGEHLHVLIEPGLDISPALSGIVEVLRIERDPVKNVYRVAGRLETEVVV